MNDIPIMEIAVKCFNKKGSKMINWCRLFLQIISVYDLLIYKTDRLHPTYIKGEIPISRHSTIAWPAYPRPPKNYWKLWHSFIHFHIEPYVQKLPLQWNSHAALRFSSSFFKHWYSHHPISNHLHQCSLQKWCYLPFRRLLMCRRS